MSLTSVVIIVGLLMDDADIAQRKAFAKMSWDERLNCIGVWETQGNLRQLYTICWSDFTERSAAAAAITRLLPAREAVDFCKLLRSRREEALCGRWIAGFRMLISHQPDEVIPYIRQVAVTSVADRHLCYSMCARVRWSDLRDLAESDLYNDALIPSTNTHGGLGRISQSAGGYLYRINVSVQ